MGKDGAKDNKILYKELKKVMKKNLSIKILWENLNYLNMKISKKIK